MQEPARHAAANRRCPIASWHHYRPEPRIKKRPALYRPRTSRLSFPQFPAGHPFLRPPRHLIASHRCGHDTGLAVQKSGHLRNWRSPRLCQMCDNFSPRCSGTAIRTRAAKHLSYDFRQYRNLLIAEVVKSGRFSWRGAADIAVRGSFAAPASVQIRLAQHIICASRLFLLTRPRVRT